MEKSTIMTHTVGAIQNNVLPQKANVVSQAIAKQRDFQIEKASTQQGSKEWQEVRGKSAGKIVVNASTNKVPTNNGFSMLEDQRSEYSFTDVVKDRGQCSLEIRDPSTQPFSIL